MTRIERCAAIVSMAIVSFGFGAAIPTLGATMAPGAPVAPLAATTVAPAQAQLLPEITSHASDLKLTHRHTVLV